MNLKKIFNKNLEIIFGILIFSLCCNKLFDFPIDKIGLPTLIIFLTILNFKRLKIDVFELILITISFVLVLLSCIYNYPDISPTIFNIIAGMILVLVISNSKISFLTLFYSLSIYVLICIIIVFFSYFFDLYDYVQPLWDKKMPWFHSPLGFSPTKQILGTFCIINVSVFIILENQKEKLTFLIYFFLLLNIICIALLFSRSSQIALLLILLLRYKKLFIFLIILSLPIIIYNQDTLNAVLNVQTLESRFKFFEGFVSNFEYNSTLTNYMIGFANTDLADYIVAHTNSKNPYVENLTCALIYSYGIAGAILYYLSSIFIIYYNRFLPYTLILILVLYLFIIPQFTHELYTSSTFLLIGIFINFKNKLIEKKN
jgi:hypothetical protein